MSDPSSVSGFQVEVRRAMSGILKRKFEEVEASSSPCSSLRESDDEVSCSESGDSSDSVNPSASGPFTRECLPFFSPVLMRCSGRTYTRRLMSAFSLSGNKYKSVKQICFF